MTIAVWILSLLLIAEFVMAPVNLRTGRTMPLFTRFTVIGFALFGSWAVALVALLAAAYPAG